jgi:hypothetical protein
MKTKILPISILMLFFFTQSKAQSDLDPSANHTTFTLNSVSISSGWYKPAMNYWNNSFLPLSGSKELFKGNLVVGGNITFNLPLNLGTRVGLWYWYDKTNGGVDATFNSLRIGFTGTSLGVFYHFKKPCIYGFYPYAGFEGSYFMIQNKLDVAGNFTKMQGHDAAVMPFIGFESNIQSKLVIGLEYGYLIGRYKQKVITIIDDLNPLVSVNGHKIQFTIGYKFP